jgi:DNA primase large subunit
MEDTLELRDLAKYPFLKESQEYVSSKTGTFNDFLKSNYGRVLVNYAAERVIRAIKSRRSVRADHIADPEKDLFSYALARVIVSCIKERGITERHARYEASRASSF